MYVGRKYIFFSDTGRCEFKNFEIWQQSMNFNLSRNVLPVNWFASAFFVPKHHADFVVIGGTNVARELHLVSNYTVNGNDWYCNKEKDKLEINLLFFLLNI